MLEGRKIRLAGIAKIEASGADQAINLKPAQRIACDNH
jgi:hypothetical protein